MHVGELHPRFGTKADEEQKLLTSLALKNIMRSTTTIVKVKKVFYLLNME